MQKSDKSRIKDKRQISLNPPLKKISHSSRVHRSFGNKQLGNDKVFTKKTKKGSEKKSETAMKSQKISKEKPLDTRQAVLGK